MGKKAGPARLIGRARAEFFAETLGKLISAILMVVAKEPQI
jgi:hypothetical protein